MRRMDEALCSPCSLGRKDDMCVLGGDVFCVYIYIRFDILSVLPCSSAIPRKRYNVSMETRRSTQQHHHSSGPIAYVWPSGTYTYECIKFCCWRLLSLFTTTHYQPTHHFGATHILRRTIRYTHLGHANTWQWSRYFHTNPTASKQSNGKLFCPLTSDVMPGDTVTVNVIDCVFYGFVKLFDLGTEGWTMRKVPVLV